MMLNNSYIAMMISEERAKDMQRAAEKARLLQQMPKNNNSRLSLIIESFRAVEPKSKIGKNIILRGTYE